MDANLIVHRPHIKDKQRLKERSPETVSNYSFAMMPKVKGEEEDRDRSERYPGRRKTKNEVDGQHQA